MNGMSFPKETKERIQNYMLELIKKNELNNCKEKTMRTFDISNTTYYRYLKDLEKNNLIEKIENHYQLIKKTKAHDCYKNINLEEDIIYWDDIAPHLSGINANAQAIWYYAFCEMMNNAIEHSSADTIQVYIEENALEITLSILDNGVGIFRNISNFIKESTGVDLSLEEAREELFFGKFTTKSENHAGEGIFFTSRIMDHFLIVSDELIFSHDIYSDFKASLTDVMSDTKLIRKGTYVTMGLSKNTNKKTADVFNIYAPVEEGFIKTEILLRNFCEHGYPVSRSQARRIINRMNKFKEITIDFEEISDIGQAFCHEIFVVFQNNYPDMKINNINANKAVSGMITRVLNTAKLKDNQK